MPVLRSSRHSSLQSSQEKSTIELPAKRNFTSDDFKREYDKIISNISTSDIKACLKSSSSEAKFYSDICREELKKLEQEKQSLEKKITLETDLNKRKDAEAARIVKKLWEEANKTNANSKNKRSPNKNAKPGLKPDDVKRVWAEAKKLSNQSKQKKRKLMSQKNQLDSKIYLAREAIKFCQKFGNSEFGSRRK